tara:strand:- start:4094 stop:4483 length:390 start_codon:yes stop_codon:yes gene_type:complete
MALITTSKSLGWYGVHTNQDCTPFKLHEQFGTYTASGSFQVGKSGLSESQASQISVWTMLPNGGAWPWSLTAEKRYRNHPLPALQELVKQHDELKCGQAYWITWTGSGDLNIPGFVPTAVGVDMGRISD